MWGYTYVLYLSSITEIELICHSCHNRQNVTAQKLSQPSMLSQPSKLLQLSRPSISTATTVSAVATANSSVTPSQLSHWFHLSQPSKLLSQNCHIHHKTVTAVSNVTCITTPWLSTVIFITAISVSQQSQLL